MKKSVQIGILAVAFVVLVAIVVNSVFRAPETADVGDRAPQWEAQLLDGTAVSSLRWDGRLRVINFWGSFCPPCVEETPLLQRMSTVHRDIQFIGINLGEKPTVRVRQFVATYGVTYPIVLDPQLTVRDKHRVISYPTTFFIDRKGTIRFVAIGGLTEARLTSLIAQLRQSDARSSVKPSAIAALGH
jgi:thiol-disulfide isomerase/thioredoxin